MITVDLLRDPAEWVFDVLAAVAALATAVAVIIAFVQLHHARTEADADRKQAADDRQEALALQRAADLERKAEQAMQTRLEVEYIGQPVDGSSSYVVRFWNDSPNVLSKVVVGYYGDEFTTAGPAPGHPGEPTGGMLRSGDMWEATCVGALSGNLTQRPRVPYVMIQFRDIYQRTWQRLADNKLRLTEEEPLFRGDAIHVSDWAATVGEPKY